jgi:hypothetical protein
VGETSQCNIHAATAIELQSHRAIGCNALDASKFAIGNLHLLIGCRELDTITDGKCSFLRAINRDTHLAARIVGCPLSVATDNCQQVFLVIHDDNANIFAFANAGLPGRSRIAEYVVTLIPLRPTAVRSCHLLAGHKHPHRVFLLLHEAACLQLFVDLHVDIAA